MVEEMVVVDDDDDDDDDVADCAVSELAMALPLLSLLLMFVARV